MATPSDALESVVTVPLTIAVAESVSVGTNAGVCAEGRATARASRPATTNERVSMTRLCLLQASTYLKNGLDGLDEGLRHALVSGLRGVQSVGAHEAPVGTEPRIEV